MIFAAIICDFITHSDNSVVIGKFIKEKLLQTFNKRLPKKSMVSR